MNLTSHTVAYSNYLTLYKQTVYILYWPSRQMKKLVNVQPLSDKSEYIFHKIKMGRTKQVPTCVPTVPRLPVSNLTRLIGHFVGQWPRPIPGDFVSS